jgi:hypothetical protein
MNKIETRHSDLTLAFTVQRQRILHLLTEYLIYLYLSLYLFMWQRGLVKLFPICHSRMEEIVPKDAPVR